MEFSVDTKSLTDALEQIQGAVHKKSTIPILSHALVEASGTGLRLAATDLELGIRMFCPRQVNVPGMPRSRLGDSSILRAREAVSMDAAYSGEPPAGCIQLSLSARLPQCGEKRTSRDFVERQSQCRGSEPN